MIDNAPSPSSTPGRDGVQLCPVAGSVVVLDNMKFLLAALSLLAFFSRVSAVPHQYVSHHVCLSVCPSGTTSVCITPCLSVCLSSTTSVCITPCLSLCLSVSAVPHQYVSHHVSLSDCPGSTTSVCITPCLSVCLSRQYHISMYHTMSVCLSVCLSRQYHISMYQTMSVCPGSTTSVCITPCLCICLHSTASVCITLCLSICLDSTTSVCITLCLCPSD